MRIYEEFPLNGTTLLEVRDNQIIATSTNGATSKLFIDDRSTKSAEEVLRANKGDIEVFIDSDVFNLNQSEYSLKSFGNKYIQKLYHEILDTAFYDQSELIEKFQTPLLYQSTFNDKSGFLFTTVGFVDDMRVILLNIRRKE